MRGISSLDLSDIVMGQYLDIAYKILFNENKPLSAAELTAKAIEKGLLATIGKTPHHTMRSKISTDILKYGIKSQFKRAASGKFALRTWGEKEFHAPRFKKSLFDEDIIVFDKKYLKEFVKKNGLINTDLDRLSKRFNQICYSFTRRKAEDDNTKIQLISVFVVKFKKKYLTFKRTKRLPESRLHGFYSVGFGGHISPEDLMPLFNIFDPNSLETFILRELSEEIKLSYLPSIKFRGLLYDNSKPVSKIHLGIVYDVSLKNPVYEIGEKGFLMDPKFEDITKIKKRINDFENWSQIIIDEELKDHESSINSR
jgi:predicted NUDIX family phosphoesterase